MTTGSPSLSLIAAASENNMIGCGGALIWHIPDDLQHFRKLTLGHTVIMGRKTWQSIGKPLPGRINIVLTRQTGYSAGGCRIASHLEAALDLAGDEKEVFIIGGADLFRQALKHADRIYLTRIHECFEGDATFPDLGGEWVLTSREDHLDGRPHAFSFLLYERL